jgi:hypothetical protein
MSTVIQIKRSTSGLAPNVDVLAEAELAYSQDRTGNGANAILYIESVDGSSNPTIHKIGGKYYTDIVDTATNTNTANKLVKRDASGDFSANAITATRFIGDVTGSILGEAQSAAIATTANALTTARTITLAGDLTGSASFDGTQNITIYGNVISNSVTLGTDTVGNYVANLTPGTGINVTGFAAESANLTVALTNTGVAAGSYGGATNVPALVIDAQGRITAAGNAAISTSFTIMGNTGTDTFNTGDTFRILGVAPGISTAATDNTISITNTGVTRVTSAGHGIVASPTTGNVVLTFTGVGSVTGTANEVEVSGSTGNITIGLPNDVTIGNNLTVTGDLIVLGSATTLNTQTVTVEDPLVKFGNANPTTALDIGFYGEYQSSGTKYVGLFADASDSYTFKLFTGLTTDPTTNVINVANYTQGTLKADLTAGNVTNLVNALAVNSGGTGRKTLTANAVLYGDGTNAVALASGTAGQVLQISAAGLVQFGMLDGGSY